MKSNALKALKKEAMNDLFNYPYEKKALSFLREALNDETAEFREHQLEAIRNIVIDRSKLLLIQRTGWGKSIVYFIATKILLDPDYYKNFLETDVIPGPAIIISPLLSLINNQILHGSKILRIEQYTSTNKDQHNRIKAKLQNNDLDILMIAPERLSDKAFMRDTFANIASRIPLLIIDEVHCISDWGHDFRPDYKKIKSILKNLSTRTPVIATTATANDRVVEDLEEILGENTSTLRGQLNRESIRLQAMEISSYDERLAFLAETIPKILNQHHMHDKKSAGIIYTLTTRDTSRVADWLKSKEIKVLEYSSKSPNREEIEEKLMNDEVDVLVATNALGMGFDKPNIRFVIHFQTPQSIVHYYQQVGRAGRNLENAYGICLFGNEDKDINSYFIDSAFPSKQNFTLVNDVLSASEIGLNASEIAREANIANKLITKVLKILESYEKPSVIKTDDKKWTKTANPMLIDWNDVERIRKRRWSEWEDMIKYINHRGCLMMYLQDRLNSPTKKECGKCSNCQKKDGNTKGDTETEIMRSAKSDLIIREASTFLKKHRGKIIPRKSWLYKFKSYSYLTDHWDTKTLSKKIKPEHVNKVGIFLCYYHDPTYGKLLRQGKKDGYFGPELVDAVSIMIKESSIMDDAKWITCVPSLNHPDLVPSFAKRVAESLNMQFINCVKKTKITKEQKSMRNSIHQQKNLDGSFELSEIKNSPVILIDDIVDSKWTLTIIGALLRDKGCSDVYPIAISSSNNMS
jgi:ATP-dependent DNA helicase RecQ